MYLWALDPRSPWNLEISVEGEELDNSGYKSTHKGQEQTTHATDNMSLSRQLQDSNPAQVGGW